MNDDKTKCADHDKHAEPLDAQIVESKDNGGGGFDGGGMPYSPLRPLWMDLLIIVGVYIGSTIILSVVMGLFSAIVGGDILLTSIVAQILVYAVTIPVAVGLMRKRGMSKPILPFSFRMADPMMIIWGVLLIFIMGVVIEPLLDIFPARYMESMNKVIIESGGLGMLMTIVLAPVLEEILFRGVIQGSASKEYGAVRGILIASAIFGIVHITPQLVINAFFSGLILGYVFYRTRSLVPVIAIHLLNNAFAYITIRMAPQAGNETIKQLINDDTWYWITYAVCAVIFVFAMFKLWQQLNRAEEKTKPR